MAAVPYDQAEAYKADSAQCLKEAGWDTTGEVTDAQLEAAYEWYTEIHACLEENGFPTPSTPSLEVFKDTYSADPWIPWILLDGSSLSDATQKCESLRP